jgi:hypothetical protein
MKNAVRKIALDENKIHIGTTKKTFKSSTPLRYWAQKMSNPLPKLSKLPSAAFLLFLESVTRRKRAATPPMLNKIRRIMLKFVSHEHEREAFANVIIVALTVVK